MSTAGLVKFQSARGETHDADGLAERLGREVAAELRADHTRLAVRAGDLAPDDADLGAADLLLRRVDVGDALQNGSRESSASHSGG